MTTTKKVRLPRLPIGWDKQPQLFERYWDEAMTGIEYNFDQILAIPGIQDAIDAANAAAAAANTAAANAQTTADTGAAANKIANSYVSGLTLTATDAGASTTITISSHTRVYGDGTTKSVTGGSLTGLAYDTFYYIYYDDPTFAGGSVTYVATTSSTTAAQTGSRHVVGGVNTPMAGDPPAPGDPVRPPGSGTLKNLP